MTHYVPKAILDRAFANAKNARLMLTEGRTEPIAGHLRWADRQTAKRVLTAIERDFSTVREAYSEAKHSRLIRAFGYVKNARLLLTELRAEAYPGHLNWARGHGAKTLRNSIKRSLKTVSNLGSIKPGFYDEWIDDFERGKWPSYDGLTGIPYTPALLKKRKRNRNKDRKSKKKYKDTLKKFGKWGKVAAGVAEAIDLTLDAYEHVKDFLANREEERQRELERQDAREYLDRIDRGNYDAERFDRTERTA